MISNCGQPYPKIYNLFKRNDSKELTREYRREEFRHISLWLLTEKVDGMNVRVHLDEGGRIAYAGRTDKATLPKKLLSYLKTTLTAEVVMQVPTTPGIPVTLYGEGYGGHIQKAGPEYGDEEKFILFDVKIGPTYWCTREQVDSIAYTLNIPCVPILGIDKVEYIRQRVSNGIESCLRKGMAEGIVAHPPLPMYDAYKNRIIFKLKTKDLNDKRNKE